MLCNGYDNWSSHLKSMIDNAGLGYILQKTSIQPCDTSCLKQRLSDIYKQNWNDNMQSNQKLRSYKRFKSNCTLEPYLCNTENLSARICLSRFRTSNHRLGIETGRHHNIPVHRRICKFCNSDAIDDESHLLVCQFHNNLRLEYNITNTDLVYLMTTGLNNNTVNYIYSCFRARGIT